MWAASFVIYLILVHCLLHSSLCWMLPTLSWLWMLLPQLGWLLMLQFELLYVCLTFSASVLKFTSKCLIVYFIHIKSTLLRLVFYFWHHVMLLALLKVTIWQPWMHIYWKLMSIMYWRQRVVTCVQLLIHAHLACRGHPNAYIISLTIGFPICLTN